MFWEGRGDGSFEDWATRTELLERFSRSLSLFHPEDFLQLTRCLASLCLCRRESAKCRSHHQRQETRVFLWVCVARQWAVLFWDCFRAQKRALVFLYTGWGLFFWCYNFLWWFRFCSCLVSATRQQPCVSSLQSVRCSFADRDWVVVQLTSKQCDLLCDPSSTLHWWCPDFVCVFPSCVGSLAIKVLLLSTFANNDKSKVRKLCGLQKLPQWNLV